MTRVRDSVDNLHTLLTAPAATVPDRPAIVDPTADGVLHTTTHRQLADLVDVYATVLADLGLDIGDRIAVEASTSAESVALLLACSLLGLPFVPLSTQAPDARITAVVDAVEPALYVRAADVPPREPLRSTPAAVLSGPGAGAGLEPGPHLAIEHKPATRIRRRREVLATDTAYIMFTSGTTGRPKGVVMSQRSIVAFLRAMLADGLAPPGARIAGASPLHFDFALFDIGTALAGGSTLIPIGRDRLTSPRRMAGLLREVAATQVHGVPSIWRPLLRHDADLLTGLSALRRIVFAGEEFPLPELRRLQAVRPDVTVVNGYGATETMGCSFTDVPNPLPPGLRRLPITAVHTGAEVTLVDDTGSVVDEPDVVGEMYLHTPALFSGYWNDPAATAAVVVPDPVDGRHGGLVFRTGDLAYRDDQGDLYFCGRADTQVQIHGNRVELGDVESVVAAFPGVSLAVATTETSASGDPILIAYVLLDRPAADFDENAALRACADRLPGYMVPREIRHVADLPLTANGKVDRRRLGLIAPSASTDRAAGHPTGEQQTTRPTPSVRTEARP